ncbi:MAG: hypothetical protein AB8G23_07965 [Myxococcota bacterium]
MSRCWMDALSVLVLAPSLLGVAVPSLARAADVIKFEVDFFEDGADEPVNHATIWTSERKVRVDQQRPGGGQSGSSLVYRGDQDLVISISDQTKSYVKVERRLLSLVEGRVRAGRRTVQGHLTGLPGDQRKGLETLLGAAREDPTAIVNPMVVKALPAEPGRLDEVAGFACAAKQMSRGSVVVGEACVADWDRIGMQPEDMEVFRSLANFQRDALGVREVTPLEIVPNQPLDLIVQFGGIPLSFERRIGEQRRSAVKVTSVDWVTDEGGMLFEVPESYTATNGFTAIMQHLAGGDAAPARHQETEQAASLVASVPAAPDPADVEVTQPPAAAAPSDSFMGSFQHATTAPATKASSAATAKPTYSSREALRRVRAAQGGRASVPRTVGATRDRKAPVRLFPNR